MTIRFGGVSEWCGVAAPSSHTCSGSALGRQHHDIRYEVKEAFGAFQPQGIDLFLSFSFCQSTGCGILFKKRHEPRRWNFTFPWACAIDRSAVGETDVRGREVHSPWVRGPDSPEAVPRPGCFSNVGLTCGEYWIRKSAPTHHRTHGPFLETKATHTLAVFFWHRGHILGGPYELGNALCDEHYPHYPHPPPSSHLPLVSPPPPHPTGGRTALFGL